MVHADTSALVIGGTQGLGLAIAERLKAEGCTRIVISGRDAAKGRAAAEALGAIYLPADLADTDSIIRLVDEAAGRLGRITALVNAGAATDEAELVRAEATDWIATVPAGSFDLVFLDPPYRDAARISEQLGPGLARVLARGGRVIAESDRRGPLEFPSLETVRERRYGRTMVTFHRVPSQSPQDPPETE